MIVMSSFMSYISIFCAKIFRYFFGFNSVSSFSERFFFSITLCWFLSEWSKSQKFFRTNPNHFPRPFIIKCYHIQKISMSNFLIILFSIASRTYHFSSFFARQLKKCTSFFSHVVNFDLFLGQSFSKLVQWLMFL